MDDGPVGTVGGRVLREALKVIEEREAMYGPPRKHWQRTATMGTVVLEEILKPGAELTPELWGKLMIVDKLARSLGPEGGRDQLVDIAGYADGIDRLDD